VIDTATIQPLNKAWGLNFAVFQNSNFEVHHAYIKSGGYSSCHCHNHKYNLFYVLSGKLLVHFYRNEETASNNHIAHTVALGYGERLIVPPKVWHRFQSVDDMDVDLIEAYWAESVDPSDIVRKDIGGTYSD
jgi:mannose-6-phosphate isomerase-like protein (cupin superfamily)